MSAANVLPALRDAFFKRLDWRGFAPRQLATLMFLYGYMAEPVLDFDVEAALPFALEEGAAVSFPRDLV